MRTDITTSRKQEIYREICFLILPNLRNLQTHNLWKRINYGTLYNELELVHNIHELIVDPNFSEKDVYWLNAQGLPFITRDGKDLLKLKNSISVLVNELVQMTPDHLRVQLKINEPTRCK